MRFEELCIEENLNKQFEDENGLIWELVNINDYGMTLKDDNHRLISDEYSVLRIFTLDFKEYKKDSFIEDGQCYYYISYKFNVENMIFRGDSFDEELLDYGNIYPYNDENQEKVFSDVKLIADKRKLQSQIEHFARENNDKEINWNDGQEKYFLCIDENSKKVEISFILHTNCLNNVYFSSFEMAQKAKEKFEEEIERLYL